MERFIGDVSLMPAVDQKLAARLMAARSGSKPVRDECIVWLASVPGMTRDRAATLRVEELALRKDGRVSFPLSIVTVTLCQEASRTVLQAAVGRRSGPLLGASSATIGRVLARCRSA